MRGVFWTFSGKLNASTSTFCPFSIAHFFSRAVETVHPQRKTAKADVVNKVISEMQNSPIAAFLRELSFHERIMLAAMILCVRKEGVEEVKWGKVRDIPSISHEFYLTHCR